MELLRYDSSGAMLAETGLDADDLPQLADRLEAARDEVLADLDLWKSGDSVPQAKQPLDAGFIDLPEQLLAEFAETPETSILGRLQTTAKRIAASSDRVLVLGIGGSYMGARALLEACCHPYYNELDREARGGWPRIYFAGNNVDNDATQGLADLLGRGRAATSVDEQWSIVVISKSGGTLETASAFRQFLPLLQSSVGGDQQQLAERIVPITGPTGRLADLSTAIGCPERFEIPNGVGGRFSILTPVGLLPAALMGLDVVQLLEGAATMNRHFRTAPAAENVVLQYTGVGHLMETQQGAHTRILSTWGNGLEAAGLWYDQLLAESLGKQEQGALPLTVVNTRDLHSRGQQHQEGRRDKLITNVIVDSPNREPLAIGASPWDQDQLNGLADKTLPQVMDAAIAGTNRAYAEDQRPTTDLHLPRQSEHALGQFFQLMMLATVTEGRLIGINPYGQPGVEGYKKHMNQFLRSN